MQVDWRRLFDDIRVPWRDRGANTSKGNVNICCPWCRDDQGFHMPVSELREAYYCYRQPQHAGTDFVRLLVKLGQGRYEAARLLNSNRGIAARAAPIAKPAVSKVRAEWERMIPAADSPVILRYIASRGFADPIGVADRYDLRFARFGKHAGRLLLPLHDGEELVSWTGRAISKNTEPRYLMQAVDREGLVYLPRAARRTLVICEGPLDGLKIAAAGEALPFAALALTGLNLNDARLWHIIKAAGDSTAIYLSLDNGTPIGLASRALAQLSAAFPGRLVRRAPIPEAYKDPGEMPEGAIYEWLRGLAI